MKLRNKKTGKVIGWFNNTDGIFPNSLAELNAEWEDYEEPEEEFWFIDSDCETYGISLAFNQNDSDDVLFNKSIGNYFETGEEAEKAVQKLKAWKRLQDKGAEFYGWRRNQTGTYELYLRWEDRTPRSYEVKNDLDLLFGGKE